MPISVDHELRRQRIAEIAADLIASRGLEAVTIRQVAKVAGFSTTIVTHYFANKQELLMYAFRYTTEAHRRRILAIMKRDPVDLLSCVEAMLPIGRYGLRAWKLYFAYWHVASVDRSFARELRDGIAATRSLLSTTLEAMVQAGHLSVDTDTVILSKRVLTFIQGIAIQTIVHPGEWSAKQQKAFMREEVNSIVVRSVQRIGT